MENSKEIGQLIEKMVSELGFNDLPSEELESFKAGMEIQINRRLGLIILENLSDEGLEEYEKAMSEEPLPDPEKLQALTQKHIPNLDEKVRAGMEEFFKEIMKSYAK